MSRGRIDHARKEPICEVQVSRRDSLEAIFCITSENPTFCFRRKMISVRSSANRSCRAISSRGIAMPRQGVETHTESIIIHPINGGVAPLYNPRTPSFRTVCNVQSNGPLKCASLLVCKRTLTVSNLFRKSNRYFTESSMRQVRGGNSNDVRMAN